MKKSLVLILFALIIAGVTLVSFWGIRQACMMMSGKGMTFTQPGYSGLNLSPEQKQNLKSLDSNFQKEANSICMNVCRERMNLMRLMEDKNADPEIIHKKIEEVGALQIVLEKKISDHILEIKKSLTPEQGEAYLKKINEELQNSIKQCGYGEILKS